MLMIHPHIMKSVRSTLLKAIILISSSKKLPIPILDDGNKPFSFT